MLLIFQDLNKGALISAQSSSNATVLDNEDKVGKITGGVVGLQLKLNCHSIELCTYLSIYSTQLYAIEYIVLCILQILLLLPYYAGSHCQPCEKARQDWEW